MSAFLNFLGRVKPSELKINANTQASQGGTSAIFPSDLFTAGNDAYILFIKRDSTNIGEVSKDNEAPQRMALYMPAQITVNYGSTWEEIQMTVYQTMDMGLELGNIGSDAINLQASALLKSGTLLARGAANLLDVVASGSNFGQQLEQVQKKTRNPHMALLFKGVNFREFQFDFQMMARNLGETESIQQIIKSFKAGMHPAVEEGSGKYWLYPDSFDIFLATGVGAADGVNSKYLFQISTAALTSMSVNYAGSGIPSFFHTNGAPVDIRMTLQFKELGVLTREKVHKGY